MCVFPRVRKNWDALSLGALGKRQGRAAGMRHSWHRGSCRTAAGPWGNPRLELLNPACLPHSSITESNFGWKKEKKKKLHKNHAKRLECRLRWGECSGNCSVCCYSSTVHKPPMDKHFSALKHWGMAKHFPSEEFKGLTNPTKNSNIIVFPTGILANLVKSLQSDFGINCILISSIDNVISVGN